MKSSKYCLSLFCLFCLVSISGASEELPNILMINVNDTNDFVGFLDGQYSDQAITPNMNSLAKKGVNFTNAHCVTPSCTPSRHGLFYGMYPFNTGLYRYNFNIYQAMDPIKKKYPEFASLNETLKKLGYKRFGLGHNHGNKDSDVKDQLGIEWDYFHTEKHLKATVNPTQSYKFEERNGWEFGPTSNKEEAYDGYRFASKAIDILQEEHEKPFFLALGIKEAHVPTLPPQKYFDLYENFQLKPIIEDDLEDVAQAGRKLAKDGADHDAIKEVDKWDIVIKSYLAILSFVDSQVGRVIHALEDSKYKENTIVILWSDHGNNYGRKLKLSKFTLWEASTRVPLIIWDTRNNKRSGICDESVSLVDIYPTLLKMIDAPAIPHLDGASLIPWLDDGDLPRDIPAITMMGRGNYAVKDREWRYIRYFNGEEELYHTRLDKNEIENVISNPAHSKIVERLKSFIPTKEEPMNPISLGPMKFYDADY